MAGRRQYSVGATVIVALLAALTSCKDGERTKPVDGTVHRGVGIVESIDRDMASIQINHEEIKDYMPAMSMPFTVKDKSLLDAAQPGDRVEFSLEATPKGQVVTEIKRVGPSAGNPERGPA
jgi:Cu/Ag efflux protein CusF